MLFPSPIFLFLFLPLVISVYYLAGRRLRNTVLLFSSLVFYFWGEQWYVLLLLSSIGLNYLFALWWADPVAGVMIALYLAKEGWETVRGEDDDAD